MYTTEAFRTIHLHDIETFWSCSTVTMQKSIIFDSWIFFNLIAHAYNPVEKATKYFGYLTQRNYYQQLFKFKFARKSSIIENFLWQNKNCFVDLKSNSALFTIRATIFEKVFWPKKLPKTEYFPTKRTILLSSRTCKFSSRACKLYFPPLLNRAIMDFSI